MMSVTLERLWLVSDRIVDFRFFVKFHRSGPAIIFNFWTITEQVSYPSKKLLIKQRYIKTSSRWWVLLWKDYGWLLRDFRFFVKFHRSGPAIIFNFWTIMEQVSYPSKKLLIKPRFIKTSSRWWVLLLERLWLVSDRIVDFRFFVKFHRSGPAIIFNFWTITEQVSYPSKKLLIKQRYIKTSSRWWVLLWKDYGWSSRIVDFRFFVKFHRSGPAIIFNSWTIMEHVSYPSKKILIKPRFIRTSSRWWVLLWKDYGWFLIELSIFDFSSNFTGPDLQ